MSLLACISVVLVFIEFQTIVDGPGMSFVGGIICPQASQTCCDNQCRFSFGRSRISCATYFEKVKATLEKILTRKEGFGKLEKWRKN